MNKEGNSYTIIYASIMVILVAVGLAWAASALHPQQAKNEAIDKMRQMLSALNITSTNQNAEELYKQTIVDAYLVDNQGTKVAGDAFDTELANEIRKPIDERNYPVFEAQVDGQKKYLLALRGTGLWGPIWGYLSLDDDKNSVFGASFGHSGETPGLGAEIEKSAFSVQFAGKKIFNANKKFTSIAIVKPGKEAAGQDYVDGISGGTITSRGVDEMLFSSLEVYVPFLTQGIADQVCNDNK